MVRYRGWDEQANWTAAVQQNTSTQAWAQLETGLSLDFRLLRGDLQGAHKIGHTFDASGLAVVGDPIPNLRAR